MTFQMRPLFWFFVVRFNVVGVDDLIADRYHVTERGTPAALGTAQPKRPVALANSIDKIRGGPWRSFATALASLGP